MSRRRVTVLGSTGSVGVSTLDLMERSGGVEAYAIEALTAGSNVAALADQALAWRPRLAVIANEALKPELDARLAGSGIETAAGDAAVEAAASAGGALGRDPGLGQQGKPRLLRPRPDRDGARGGRSCHPGRFRALGDLPGAGDAKHRSGRPPDPDGVWRPLPGPAAGGHARGHA